MVGLSRALFNGCLAARLLLVCMPSGARLAGSLVAALKGLHARRRGWCAHNAPVELQYKWLNCTLYMHAGLRAFVADHVGLCAAVRMAVRRSAHSSSVQKLPDL